MARADEWSGNIQTGSSASQLNNVHASGSSPSSGIIIEWNLELSIHLQLTATGLCAALPGRKPCPGVESKEPGPSAREENTLCPRVEVFYPKEAINSATEDKVWALKFI